MKYSYGSKTTPLNGQTPKKSLLGRVNSHLQHLPIEDAKDVVRNLHQLDDQLWVFAHDDLPVDLCVRGVIRSMVAFTVQNYPVPSSDLCQSHLCTALFGVIAPNANCFTAAPSAQNTYAARLQFKQLVRKHSSNRHTISIAERWRELFSYAMRCQFQFGLDTPSNGDNIGFGAENLFRAFYGTTAPYIKYDRRK